MSSLTVPNELTEPERNAIVSHFKGLRKAGVQEIHCFDVSLQERPPLFVKHSAFDVLAEASTQHFFYTLANGNESAPLIPRVFDAFTLEGYSFIVMQKITAPTLSTCGITEEEAVEYAASAVKWLLNQMSFVPGSVFGRISSKKALVFHQFFKDHEAPVAFANADALLKYVKKAFTRCTPGAQPSPSALEELSTSFMEGLCIYHCDINKDGFLLDSNNKVWMIDFLHVGVLPCVFQTYAFFNISLSFAAKVGRKLGYQPSSLANELVRASTVLYQTGMNACLRLDEFGNPIRY